MSTLFKLQSVLAAAIVSSLWASPASAGLISDLFGGGCFFNCGGNPGGGPAAAPEINSGAGIAAMALLAGVAAIIYRKAKH